MIYKKSTVSGFLKVSRDKNRQSKTIAATKSKLLFDEGHVKLKLSKANL